MAGPYIPDGWLKRHNREKEIVLCQSVDLFKRRSKRDYAQSVSSIASVVPQHSPSMRTETESGGEMFGFDAR